MRTVALLTTGGTIASQREGDALVAAVPGEQLADGAPADVGVRLRDLGCRGSYSLTAADLGMLAAAVRDAAAEPDVTGVVVTHGTDTLEETALAIDLTYDGAPPVVLTGAQRPADAPDADGPANLADAVRLAADPRAAGLGVVVCAAGQVLAARGVVKQHTRDLVAFASRDGTSLGRVRSGEVVLHPRRPRTAPFPGLAAFDERVELLRLGIGASGLLLDAAVDHGARGVVIEAFGTGNVTAAVARSVRRAIARGVAVLLATRVARGPVVPLYGGEGGGATLVRAGACPVGHLSGPQARVLLMAALAWTGSPQAAVDEVREFAAAG